MSNYQYLPKEQITSVNYPVLQIYSSDIQDIGNYALEINSSISNYQKGVTSKIIVNLNTLQLYITKCRTVCERLNSGAICIDVLRNIREIQYILQNVYYLSTLQNSIVSSSSDTIRGDI